VLRITGFHSSKKQPFMMVVEGRLQKYYFKEKG
jgi:hypothetical protein